MGYVTLTTLPMDIIYLPLTSTYHDQSAYQISIVAAKFNYLIPKFLFNISS